jgi:hypothetical protein
MWFTVDDKAEVKIAIERLASGPTPPVAANATWPNVLHTRAADGRAPLVQADHR